MSVFRFKQFSVAQDKCAMKVGTDGVLLGAWCHHYSPKTILDIGSGTGLIALMCAQRFSSASITAIEPETQAFQQAKENITQSPFNSIHLLETNLQAYIPEHHFDLIVCNPPFFKEATLAPNTKRAQARSANYLPLNDILSFAQQHLNESGSLQLILPFSQLEELKNNHQQLFLTNYTVVKGTKEKAAKRVLAALSKHQSSKIVKDELVIEHSRHIFTDDYLALTKDFYLNF